MPQILATILGLLLFVVAQKCCADDSLHVRKTGEIVHADWTIQDVAVDGENAYYTCWEHGIRIVDISNPDAIYERPAESPPCWGIGICVAGGYVYDAANCNGFFVVDVSNPDSMYPRGWCDPPGWSRNVAFQDHYAYVVSEYGGLQIIDVQNPDTLVERGLFLAGNTWGVAVRDYCAFLASLDSGLFVVNVSDPNAPSKLSRLPLTGCTNLALSDERLLIATAAGVALVDVTVVEAPVVTATFPLPTQPKDVAIVDDLVFVADGMDGLRVLRILNPASIEEVGHYRLAGTLSAEGVDAVGNRVYVAYGNRFCAFEFTRPTTAYEPSTQVAREIELLPSYPNPFNSTATIRFILSRGLPAEVCIYDMKGRLVNRVTQGYFLAGEHTLTFDGLGLASGMYVCRLTAGRFTDSQKLMLVK